MEHVVTIVTTAATPTAVVRWCTANAAGARWEVYGHWRDEDPQAFETEIYWLVSSTRSSAS